MPLIVPKMAFCQKHCEVLRQHWPRGYATMVTDMTSKVLQDPVFLASCGQSLKDLSSKLLELPLCCRIPTADLLQLYRSVLPNTQARCTNCGQVRQGVAYVSRNHWGRVKQSKHTCLECILRSAKPKPDRH